MPTKMLVFRMAVLFMLVALVANRSAAGKEYLSHPPMRPLPRPSDRPMAKTPAYFVDPGKGSDKNPGTKEKPFATINHAIERLRPGETLYLRGGIYYEHVDVIVSGKPKQPITIRSYPGELAILDGGLREFFETPANAWEPFKGGADGEFVSTRTYPQFAKRPILNAFLAAGWEPFIGIEEQRPVVQGNFADSMVPLHGYRTLADLRDNSMLWDVKSKFDSGGVYCGPGLYYNRQTKRIHIRLAHTNLEGLGSASYRGVTDPRKIPLVVSGPCGTDVLRLNGVKHIVLQDFVLRGASGSPLINVYNGEDITFDGLTAFGGSPGLLVKAVSRFRIVNCAFRGLAAPWSSRASMKYRGTPSYLIITQRNQPQNRDFEFAYNEFTDGHDFAWLRYVKNLKFHHNYVDNFNDDGLEVGALKRDQELYIFQNLVSRCLLTLTLHEMERDESPADVDPGSGVFICRNVFDLRRGVFKSVPTKPDPRGKFLDGSCMLCGDHGGPVWPHYYFYHNTVVRADPAWRGYYGFGIGGRGLRRSKRRVFNNIFVQLQGIPGLNFASNDDDVVVDGNLHWGVADGPSYKGDFFKNQGRQFAFRNKEWPREWMRRDLFADPKFAKLTLNINDSAELTLRESSPAINAGVNIPDSWFDPLRMADQGVPDIGAFPHGQKPWQIGVRGRMHVFGGR
ncbi:MAG: hypothetical protein KatS3mg105_0466 [Gemmatales bacterium]|nr:MAG: hypothetical protein KatS3mg105_0466 [Gemmatales bacterium]